MKIKIVMPKWLNRKKKKERTRDIQFTNSSNFTLFNIIKTIVVASIVIVVGLGIFLEMNTQMNNIVTNINSTTNSTQNSPSLTITSNAITYMYIIIGGTFLFMIFRLIRVIFIL